MDPTAAHWTYLAGVVVIIAVMVLRKNVVVPAVVATFVTAWVLSGSPVAALSSIFTAGLTAATELFTIFLIIALITALLGALRSMGAEGRMVRPFRGLMRNGRIAFLVLVGATYLISLFFWPTPAVPLIGAILLPVAIRSGLPAPGAAAAIAIAGQGMALSSDYVIQVAPELSAKAAGITTGAVADRAMVLSLVAGAVALSVLYWRTRRHILPASSDNLLRWEATARTGPLAAEDGGSVVAEAEHLTTVPAKPAAGTAAEAATTVRALPRAPGPGGTGDASGATDTGRHPSGTGRGGGPVRRSRFFAALVPAAFGALVVYMALGRFTSLVPGVEGTDAAALVGGVAVLLLFAASFCMDGSGGLTSSADHIVDGLVFAFRAMGVVLPIAGFFFLGNPEFIGRIVPAGVADQPPALLSDLARAGQDYIPDNPVVLSFSLLLIGMITGLEGSGFSGLPLTGSLAGALGPAAGADPAALAAVGQLGSVWTGGGVLIAWSSLLTVAGVARVPVQELARRCFVPVIAGLTAATVVSVLLF